MKHVNVLSGQAVRFLKFDMRDGESAPDPYDLVRGVEKLFKFVEAPQKVEEVDFTKGVQFRGGKFRGGAVDRVSIYGNGVIAEMRANTDECDDLIGDLLSWVEGSFPISVSEDSHLSRVYNSEIEFAPNTDFFGNVLLASVESALSDSWSKYGQGAMPFQAATISFAAEQQSSSAITPSPFTVERRAGHRFSENIFHSRAPLKTRDHISLLTNIETMLTG